MTEKDTDDTAAAAADPQTVEVTAARELGEAGLAWSVDNDASEVEGAQDDRRPLPGLCGFARHRRRRRVSDYGVHFGTWRHNVSGPSSAPVPPATTASSSIAAAPPPAAPPPIAAPAIPPATSTPPTVTVTADNPSLKCGPPMAHGAVLGRPYEPYGPTFGYAVDGSVLACPSFGNWVQTAGWSGVHEIGAPCQSGEGSAVSPRGIGLVCVSSSPYGASTWQPGP
ncbi:hypothetical protein K883_00031 [Mycobacterium sp. TKK-01-0059]|uniref:hypothetical protein n=1 Tax=Mycobacterium intracellulare TaxID=1767 RepID=UPI0004DA34E0|nr:hypothetical protein [Mycobacterium intracellulare]KEF99981.1 hypothetical protein K883_00031 [Mycobacterium sp. TKK-01-0059]